MPAKTPAQIRAKQKYDRSLKGREADRRGYFRRKYGLTLEEIELLKIRQANKCTVCKSSDNLRVDHCHDSGKVRGLLCDNCNLLLGRAKDNPQLLNELAAYLIYHQKMILKPFPKPQVEDLKFQQIDWSVDQV